MHGMTVSYDTIKCDFETDEMCATITLDRPESQKALSEQLLRELEDALDRVESDEAIRAVVLTGRGKAFSVGYDMDDSGSVSTTGGAGKDSTPSVDDFIDEKERIAFHFHMIWELNKPVVGAVKGHCLAGGSDLVMMSDVIIASKDASLGYPGQRMADHPPMLTYPFFMGIHQAKELLLTEKVVNAERASELEVFNRVIEPDELYQQHTRRLMRSRRFPATAYESRNTRSTQSSNSRG